jgi:protein-disulfide isomerase
MKGSPSDVGWLLALLVVSLTANVALVRQVLNLRAQMPHVPTAQEFTKDLAKRARHEIPIPSDGARVVVVKFNDYQCPPCRKAYYNFEPVLRRLQAERPGTIKFVVKDYPLDSTCNTAVKTSVHPAACEAAVAVRLASRVGKGDELAAWLFAHQASLTPEFVRGAERSITGREHTEADYKAAVVEVEQDVALGTKLGVAGTPAFFVNGVQVNAPNAQLFEAAIEYELSQAADARR